MDGYYDCWFHTANGVVPIKLVKSAFDSLYAFFRENKTEEEAMTVCSLDITMNAYTPQEYELHLEGVWQVTAGYQLANITAGVN